MQQRFLFFGNFTSNTLDTQEVFSLFLLAEDASSMRLKAPNPSIEVTQPLQNYLGWEPCSAWCSEFLYTTKCPNADPRPWPQPQMDVNQSSPQQGTPDTLHSSTAPMLQELWRPLQAEVLSPTNCTWPAALGHTKGQLSPSSVKALSWDLQKKKRQAYVRVPINITTFVLNSMFKYH